LKARRESASAEIIAAAEELRDAVGSLQFAEPVTHVYSPLDYAWEAHRLFLERFGGGRKRVLFLGMNPGPFGMAQTGVPFGEVAAVRDWMGVEAPVGVPENPHPKRPIEGYACSRSEVSGRRLWGLFAERFDSAPAFFEEHFVLNYCPLVFMEESGRNRTPDKLPAKEREALYAACDEHLSRSIAIMKPEWLVGVGGFARKCLERVAQGHPKIGTVLHPSPASPAANRGWDAAATRQLLEQGIWSDNGD
jgi:single-strand selective monofunctional uracil DNA glycosylase